MTGVNLNMAVGDGDEQSDKQPASRELSPENYSMAEEGDGFYLVEDIRKKRYEKGEVQYQVKWRNLPESENTWEPLANLRSCTALINAFEESLKARKKSSRKCRRTMKKRQVEDNVYDRAAEAEDDRAEDENDLSMKISELKVSAAATNSQVPTDTLLSGSLIGAKRRKYGIMKRFKPEADASTSTVDAMGDIVSSTYQGIQNGTPMAPLYENIPIIELLQPISSTTRTLNNVKDVLIYYQVKRSDGSLITVDNKYLMSNYPDLLVDYYEQHLHPPSDMISLFTDQ